MNKIYRLIFNRDLGVMQVASELTGTRSGSGGARTLRQLRRPHLAAAVLAACLSFGTMSSAWAQNSPDFAAIFDDNYLMSPDTAANYDWVKIRTWGMIIGHESNGHVTIRDGLLVESSGITLGLNAGVTGQLDVIGPNTTLTRGTFGDNAYVGLAGTGIFNVLQGGKAVITNALDGALRVGWEATGTGTVNVDGTGSEMQTRLAQIGHDGTGTLNITNGGKFSVGNLNNDGVAITIADRETATGTVLVNGTDSLLDVFSGAFLVGDGGEGKLTISGGGRVITTTGGLSSGVVVGYETSGKGSIDITDAGSTLSASSLSIGSSGNGQVTVRNGGRIESSREQPIDGWLNIGRNATGTGSLLLEGASTTLDSKGGGARIGSGGLGEMTIRAGASAMLGDINIGQDAKSNGTVLVTGAGSRLSTGNEHTIDIGREGSGSLKVLDGAEVSAGNLIVGSLPTTNNENPSASVLVSGTDSQMNVAGEVVVANQETGSLVVEKGASFKAGSLRLEVDEDGSSPYTDLTGEVRITGPGTRFETTGMFAASAHFSLTDGATLQSGGARIAATYATDQGKRAFVTGAETTWSNTGDLSVSTAMDITAGAKVSTDTLTLQASNLTSHSGGSLLSSLRILGEGSRLTTSGDVTLGSGFGPLPGFLVLADGGQLQAGGDVRFDGGAGLSFGTVLTYDDSGNPAISAPQAPGSINADARFFFTDRAGAESLVFNHTSDNLLLANAMVSEGHAIGHRGGGGITSLAGTSRLTGDLSQFTGRIDVQGGKLVLDADVNVKPENYDLDNDQQFIQTADVTNGTLIVNRGFGFEMMSSVNNTTYGGTSAFSVHSGGTLGGAGRIFGSVEAFDAGHISPGDGTAATLSISGDLSFGKSGESDTTAFYDVDLRNNGTSDLLDVSGKALLDVNGIATTVNVTALDAGTSYRNGQQYTILTAAGGVEGTFDNVLSKSAFLTPTLTYDANNVFLRVGLNTSKILAVVNDGEVFSDPGPWAGLEVRSGGTVSPGTSTAPIGTVSVVGPVVFKNGSFFDVDIKGDGTNDKVTTTGTATLEGGTVRVTALDPQTSYQNGQQYTLLTADGGLTGTFADAISRSAFLTPTLSYNANNVLLNIALVTTPNDGIVNDGEVLMGSDSYDSITVNAGGTLSPGDTTAPIGTVSATGPVVFKNGSFFDVDIKGDGTNDKVTTTGTATLEGGTVRVTALDPQTSYQNGQQYTLLTADGGLTGTFADAISRSAFLTPTLSYNANNVLLNIALTTGGGGENPGPGPGPGVPPIFETVAETRNQYNVAVGLDALPQQGEALALYNRLLLLSAEEARAAYGSLSGELHAATRSGLLDDRFVREGVQRRMLGDVAAQAGTGITAWVDGSASGSSIDSDGNGAKASGQRAGVLAGVDWALGDTIALGVVGGVEDIDRTIPAWNSSASTNAAHLGLYATSTWGPLSVSGGASHAWYSTDTVRRSSVGGIGDRLTSSYDASATTFFAEGGWELSLGKTTLTPYLAVAHSRLKTDAATEEGGSTALRIDDSKDELLTATAGVRASWDLGGAHEDGTRLTAGLAWQNASGELKQGQRAGLLVGGSDFAVYGAPLARNMGIAEVGLNLRASEASRVLLNLQGRFGGGQREAGGQVNWIWAF